MEVRALLTIELEGLTLYLSTEDLSFAEGAATDIMYHGRIIDIDPVKRSMTESFYGANTSSQISATLDNTDSYFSKLISQYEFRGVEVSYTLADIEADEVLRTFYFKVVSLEIGIESARLALGDADYDAWETIIPKYRITADLFETGSIPDESMGKPVGVWFGQAKNVPLYCISENTDTDEYDYLIGHGDIESVDAVYRGGDGTEITVNNTIVVSGTNTTATALRLIDSNATFISSGVKRNMAVINLGTGRGAFVESVDSETQLTITEDIFDASHVGESYKVGGEYIVYDGSQSEPYPGFAFIRFALEQRDANGTLYAMRADVTASSDASVNPLMVLYNLITDDDWGLGLSASQLTWLVAARQIDGLAWRVNGGFWEFKKAKEWRDMLLLQAQLAQLSMTSNGYYIATVPIYADGSDIFNQHNMQVQSFSATPVDEYANEIIVHYKYDINEGNYLLETTQSNGKAFGQTRDFYMPFLTHDDGATAIARLLANRFFYQDWVLEFNTGLDGVSLAILNAIIIDYHDIGIYSKNYEVRETEIGAQGARIAAAPCPKALFNY